MRPSISAAFTAALLLAALPVLTGCERGSVAKTPPAAPGPTVPAEPAPAAAAAPVASEAIDDVAPPEGVLRAYVWECEGGQTLRMKNLYRERAITLEMHEGPRRLPQVVSASGARYSDGSLTFWTKGSSATFERAGSAPLTCRELRSQSLLADARERGVRYRGIGNEPGWTVEVGPGTRLEFVTSYGQERYAFETAAVDGDGVGEQAFVAGQDAERIEVTVTQETCADDMSGETFTHRMRMEFGGKTYQGCATALD